MNATEETVALRVPGALARAVEIQTAGDAEALAAARRDLRTAWNTGSERRQGVGTVYVFDIPTELLGHFTDIVAHIHWLESADGVDGQDRAAARAAARFLTRLAAGHGVTPQAPGARPYRGDHTAEQRARAAGHSARRARKEAEEAAQQHQREARDATRAETVDRVGAILGRAGHPAAVKKGNRTVSGGYRIFSSAETDVLTIRAVPDPDAPNPQGQVNTWLIDYNRALTEAGCTITKTVRTGYRTTALRITPPPPTAEEIRQALRYLGARSATLHPAEETGAEETYVSVSLADMTNVLNEIPQERW